MAGTTLVRGHTFISYVREDKELVDQLQKVLEDAGIPVWRDVDKLQPGDDWAGEIRQAIADAEVFVACFSDHYLARRAPYLNEELVLAIEQLRKRHAKPRWFFPVRLNDCKIPDRPIDATRTLLSFNWVDLFDGRWDEGSRGLVRAILDGKRPRRPRPPAGATRREVPARTPPENRTRRDGAHQADPYISVVLPAPLAERFRVVDEVPTQGAEATVMVAEELASGATRLLKLYRRGIELDSNAVAVLTTLSQSEEGRPHIVTLYETGTVAGLWYEVQEFCPHRSLREALKAHYRVDPSVLAAELAGALGFLEGRLYMRDLKPENLLVRSIDPLDVVVGDFGLARNAQAGSVRWTEGGTTAYMPPEAGGNRVTGAWDWWSAGMLLAEVALGRHPLADDDGHLPPSLQILDLINRTPIDVSGIADEHLRHLCRGLLVRDPDHRWRAEQVHAWLAGERPEVPADEARPGAGGRTPVAVQTAAVQFLGRACNDPASLATAFQARWEQARDWLFADGAPTWWRRQVVGLLRAHDCAHAADLVDHSLHGPANVHEAMAQLLLDMNPDLRPVFNGIHVTREGLHRAALGAKGDKGTAPRLEEVRLGGVLTLWDSLPGMVGTAEIDLDWQDGCRRIDDYLYGLLHGAIEEGGRLGEELRAAAKRANAWLLLCAVDESGRDVADLWGALDAARSSPANEIPWWRWLVDSSEESQQALPAAVLAVVTERYARFSLKEWIDRPPGGNLQ